MRREGDIVYNEKDIRDSGLSKDDFYEKIRLYFQDRTDRGIEMHPVRIFKKRRAIEIKFVGRSVVDADIISLQDYLSHQVINALANGVTS